MGTHQPVPKLEMIQLIALLWFSYFFFLTGCVSRKAFRPLSIHVLKFGSGYPLMKLLKRGGSVAILTQISVDVKYLSSSQPKKGLFTFAVLKSLVKGLDHVLREAATSDMNAVKLGII